MVDLMTGRDGLSADLIARSVGLDISSMRDSFAAHFPARCKRLLDTHLVMDAEHSSWLVCGLRT